MKKIYAILLITFFVILVFFTIRGEDVYNMINPFVESYAIQETYSFGEEEQYYRIPRTALSADGNVYVILTVQGFSMKISTVEKRKVECADIMNEYYDADKYIFVVFGLKNGEMIVNNAENGFSDGQKVVVK